jgi:hypothetical protein
MFKFKWLGGKPMVPYVIPAMRWVGHPNSIPMQDRCYKLGEITYEDLCAWRDEVKREAEEVDRLAPPEYWECVLSENDLRQYHEGKLADMLPWLKEKNNA